MTESNEKTLVDIAITGGLGAMIAILFQAIRASREHVSDTWDTKRFIVGLCSAGGVGALVAWALDYFGIGRELSAVIIAMCGYTGGRILDIVEAEVLETIKAGFDGLQKRLSEGKWRKDD